MYSFTYNSCREEFTITDGCVTLIMDLRKCEHIPYICYILKNPDECTRGIYEIGINWELIIFKGVDVTINISYDTYADTLYDALSESEYDEKDFSQFDRDITDNFHNFGIVFVHESLWYKINTFNEISIILDFNDDDKKDLIKFINFKHIYTADNVISFCNGQFEIAYDNNVLTYTKYELNNGIIFSLIRPFVPSYCKKLIQTESLLKDNILKSLKNIIKI